jgi:hypothetical protein
MGIVGVLLPPPSMPMLMLVLMTMPELDCLGDALEAENDLFNNWLAARTTRLNSDVKGSACRTLLAKVRCRNHLS